MEIRTLRFKKAETIHYLRSEISDKDFTRVLDILCDMGFDIAGITLTEFTARLNGGKKDRCHVINSSDIRPFLKRAYQIKKEIELKTVEV